MKPNNEKITAETTLLRVLCNGGRIDLSNGFGTILRNSTTVKSSQIVAEVDHLEMRFPLNEKGLEAALVWIQLSAVERYKAYLESKA